MLNRLILKILSVTAVLLWAEKEGSPSPDGECPDSQLAGADASLQYLHGQC